MRKKYFLLLLLLASFTAVSAQIETRKEIRIPNILGYRTLKCDFHMHTVFSDGDVWPALRVQEAWSEGLDAIALTDHIEYQPKKNDIPTNHNRPFEIAKPLADRLGISLIKGGEITRDMPPGHMNLLFVEDGNALKKEDWKETVLEGKKQGAILFWNHPSWTAQQPDGIARWYDAHTWVAEQGMMMGIEIVNGPDYSPEAHSWCIKNKFTLVGNSDIHSPIMHEYNLHAGEHRTMTLVFADENTPEAVRDALVKGRTAVYAGTTLYGDEKFLKPIFEKSVMFKKNEVKAVGKGTCYLQVMNDSDVPYTLVLKSKNDKIVFPQTITLPANRTVQFPVKAVSDDILFEDSINVEYEVKNLVSEPGKGIAVKFDFEIAITPKKK